MQYRSLMPASLDELRRNRVHELEIDHARLRLELEEQLGEPPAALISQLQEVERRITHHLTALGIDDESDLSAPPASGAPGEAPATGD